EVEDPRLQHVEKRLHRKIVRTDGGEQRCCHRTAARLFGRAGLEHITPPLQADFTRQWLRYAFAHRGNFHVEGVKGKQRRALVLRRVKGGEIPVGIGLPYQRLSLGCQKGFTQRQSTQPRPRGPPPGERCRSALRLPSTSLQRSRRPPAIWP